MDFLLAVPLLSLPILLLQYCSSNTFALLMQGKLLIRTERAVLMKAEDKE